MSFPFAKSAPNPREYNERILTDAKALYDTEDARRKEVDDRARSILTLSAAYTAFVALVFKDAKPIALISKELVYATVVALAISLLSAAVCCAVRTFMEPYAPNELIVASDDGTFDMEEYVLNLTAGHICAVEFNRRVDAKKVLALGLSYISLAVGIILHAASVLSII